MCVMIEAPPFPNEQQRIASLKLLQLLDTPIEERFERITRMVCRLLDVPIAIFNLIDDQRQYYKSVRGLPNTEASLEGAFCTHALHEEQMMLVPNASKDERFHDNPFVNGDRLNVGFYAGCPVRTPDGMPVGTLCAIDTQPREMTPEQLETLNDLASMVETELRLSTISTSQSELIKELGAAKRLAMIDPLTRLWNRGGLTQLVAKEWSEAVRQQKPVTIVMADIDHFKKINDTHGHAAGDMVLRAVAKRLLESARQEDVVGRYGGEEFLLLLTDCLPEKAATIIERMRAAIAALSIDTGEVKISITMSFGVASDIPQRGHSSDVLVGQADAALYQAKDNGRNRVELAG